MSKDAVIEKLEAENVELRYEQSALKHEIAQLRKLIFGARSEKYKPTPVDPNQLNVFGDMEDNAEQAAPAATQVKGYTKTKKKHPGRQLLPDHLPVEEVIIEPQEDTTNLKQIGQEVTEVLDYTPASIVKRRYIRPKYAKADGQGVIVAPMPERPLPKAIAEAGLLANIAVSKFVEHTPFYRQIQKFERNYQLSIPSSTINDWFVATCTLLQPLYEEHQRQVLATDYLQADESPIKVLDSDKKGKSHQGYMWVYHNPLAKAVLFDYRKGRGQNGPKEILSDYRGILQCDGYTVYDKIGKSKDITLAGCLVHVRRKYVEAKDSDPRLAEFALKIFSEVYRHERLAKQSEDRKAYRDQHIAPLLYDLRDWIDEKCITTLPKSPIGKAMSYTVKQWPKVVNIFTDGRVELDNNLIENKIRPLALGRKNYLFAGSHAGAKRIAMMYSFFATCKANEVNPFDWLKSTLQQIPTTKMTELQKLLPQNFQT